MQPNISSSGSKLVFQSAAPPRSWPFLKVGQFWQTNLSGWRRSRKTKANSAASFLAAVRSLVNSRGCVSWHRAIKTPLAAVGKSSDRCPRSVSISIRAQKKRHVVVGFPVVQKIDRYRNIIRLAFQACPLQGMGVARTADNHHLAANFNHDVANPRSRITLDGHPRRRKLLSHGRVAKSFPGGTVGIGGNRRTPSRPGAAGSGPRARRGSLARATFRSYAFRE
jgi:hypothetical protein